MAVRKMRHNKTVYRMTISAGGEEKNIINLVCKKVKRGKSLSVIAEELEEEEESLKVIYEAVLDATPDYDVDQIYKVLHGEEE